MKNNKQIVLKPGTIVCWKEYGLLESIWSKLRNKSLSCNRYAVVPIDIPLNKISKHIREVYEPIRKYTDNEHYKLLIGHYKSNHECDWDEVKTIVNSIRPNTFNNRSIESSRYYREVNINE